MKKDQNAREKFAPMGAENSVLAQATSPKLLLSAAEAAELLGVSKRTVFVLLASGAMKRTKVRRRTLIHRDDVVRFARGTRLS